MDTDYRPERQAMTYRLSFTTPYDQYAAQEGQPFTVVRVIDQPDEAHDAEVLPMYMIRFPDGLEIEAWPEEVLSPRALRDAVQPIVQEAADYRDRGA